MAEREIENKIVIKIIPLETIFMNYTQTFSSSFTRKLAGAPVTRREEQEEEEEAEVMCKEER